MLDVNTNLPYGKCPSVNSYRMFQYNFQFSAFMKICQTRLPIRWHIWRGASRDFSIHLACLHCHCFFRKFLLFNFKLNVKICTNFFANIKVNKQSVHTRVTISFLLENEDLLGTSFPGNNYDVEVLAPYLNAQSRCCVPNHFS